MDNANSGAIHCYDMATVAGYAAHRQPVRHPLTTRAGRQVDDAGSRGIVGMKRRRGLHGTVVVRVALPPSTRSPSADGAHTGRPAVMEIIGLDLHKRESQLSSKADDGTITDRRIATSR